MRMHRHTLAGLIAVIGLVLGGCGFSPLYSSAGYQRLGGISVEAGAERFDYLLQNAVRDFAGPGDSPYVIRVNTRVTRLVAGISPSGIASRVALTGQAAYTLAGVGAPITGTTQVSVSFDQPSDPYAQIASFSDAEERLAVRLAEELLQDVSVELRRREAGLTPG
ncbi:MAG: hypothetical protein RIA71_00610 [Oceanicaulis sp.]